MIAVLIFAAAYAIKGGWLGKIPAVRAFEKEGWLQSRMTDGKVLSSLLLFHYGLLAPVEGWNPWVFPFALVTAWLIAVTPSMGEEAGAVGRFKSWWGDYEVAGFSRSYGIKKALQRGCWMGAMFTLLTANLSFIPVLTVGFVVATFIGQELYYRIHKTDSWAYAEPIIGMLIGLCYAHNFFG